jgi:5-formyltetrahydrofolate cyclo-ligase
MQTTTPPGGKEQIRHEALCRRKALTSAQAAASGRAVLKNVLTLAEFARARCLHTYVSGKDNEVDTLELIACALKMGKQVTVPVIARPEQIAAPHIALGSWAMGHAFLASSDELTSQHWGVPQPDPHTAHWLDDLSALDLIVVPGLAFDRAGRRIGYGLGYYDRLLAQVKAPRIGLAYEVSLFDQIPVSPHDIPMHQVITESTVYQGAMP